MPSVVLSCLIVCIAPPGSPVRETTPRVTEPIDARPRASVRDSAAPNQAAHADDGDEAAPRKAGGHGVGPGGETLEFVDAGFEDVGPLATSFRLEPEDLRLPTGFQRVYRVPGDPDKLMRGNGALFAVFPTSVYRRSARGSVPVAPAAVVYHFGVPGEDPIEELKRRGAARPDFAGPRPKDFRPTETPAVAPAPAPARPERTQEKASDDRAPDAAAGPYDHLGFGPQPK